MAAWRRGIIGVVVALAFLAGSGPPANAQVAEERSFYVVMGLLCLGPGPVNGVLLGVVRFEETHGDIFRFCQAGDPPFLSVGRIDGALSVGGGGGTSSPGATCRGSSFVTVCTLPDGVSGVVAIFAVFEQPPAPAVVSQLSSSLR